MQDTGYRMQDAGYRIQDTGCRMFGELYHCKMFSIGSIIEIQEIRENIKE